MIKITTVLFILIFISNCSEKKYYYGKIIPDDFNIDKIENKIDLEKILGIPTFIDPIENKYYYYSEEKISKNFFNNKIANRNILLFKFDQNNKIILKDSYNLDDEREIKIFKDTTENNIIKRGLIEKIFGGIGRNTLSNTSQ